MKKVKGFSFDTEKDKEILEYIEKQPNMSSYIKELIRKDMRKESIDEIVRKQIEKYLEGFEIKKKDNDTNINTASIMDILRM